MNSDDLIVFLRVAEEASVTKAAQRLGYVPSNVTARIRQLETDLGTTLFYRHRRGMTLSADGKLLLDYAQQIHHLLRDAQYALQSSDTPRGALTLGSIETAAAIRLPKILASYLRDHPQVNLSLVTGPTSSLLERVLQYQVDGAFVTGPINEPHLTQHLVFHEELVLAAEPQQTPLAALMRRPILVFPLGCSYRFRLEQWLLSEGWPNPRVMEFGTLEAILGGVMAGLGVSLLPQSVTKPMEDRGLIVSHSIPDRFGIVDTFFTYRNDTLFGNALRSFIHFLPSDVSP